MITAAALCPWPPLLVRELTGADPVLPELREACAAAVAVLLAGPPDVVAVVAPGPVTAACPADGRLNIAAFGGAPATPVSGMCCPNLGDPEPGTPQSGMYSADPGDPEPGTPQSGICSADPGDPEPGTPQSGICSRAPGAGVGNGRPALPPAAGMGAYLLDRAGYAGPRVIWTVGEDEPPADCAKLGAELAAADARTALLVLGDGSARRGPKAPGAFDERAAGFDAGVERAVRDGDLDALLNVDPVLARELMATGRPAWQVLAGALAGLAPATTVRYCDDPFGVLYLVASLAPSLSRDGGRG